MLLGTTGVNVEEKDQFGRTPLHLAAKVCIEDIIMLYLFSIYVCSMYTYPTRRIYDILPYLILYVPYHEQDIHNLIISVHDRYVYQTRTVPVVVFFESSQIF